MWAAGDPDWLRRGMRIAVVGSRSPRDDSMSHARRIARDAARAGFTVVSGLAIGIDGVAHRAALDAGGATIAVLAGGLGHVHPRRHVQLAQQIAGNRSPGGVVAGAADQQAHGVVVSEFSAGAEPPAPWQFRVRNRIIAALSDYVVVVQAQPQSGSMHTAHAALELGIPVGIVPSAPADSCYGGSIDLVRDGADCVVDGRSLFARLEAHRLVERGFAAAIAAGGRLDPDRRGCWVGADPAVDAQHPRDDHPLASILQVPRTAEEVAHLAGCSLREVRSMLLELEDDGDAVHTDDGCWVASTAAVVR